MQDVILGLLAVLVGLLFGLRGFIAMRILISAWGAFVGFLLGAGLVEMATGDGFLMVATGWFVGGVLALVFGLLAYLYYQVAVVIGMASIGFTLGTSAMVALGMSWSWVVVLIGVLLGALLALAAIVTDLPAVILIVLTSLGGASVTVFGLLLLLDSIGTADFNSATVTQRLDNWWWSAIYLVLAVVGIVVQSRLAGRMTASAAEQWRKAPRAA